MLKRSAVLFVVLALAMVVIAPAAASATQIVKTWSNSNTDCRTVLTYTPSSSSDYIASVSGSVVSSANCYRKMSCSVSSWTTTKYSRSTSVFKTGGQSNAFSPGVYVNHGWNSTSITYFAGNSSSLLVGYYTAAFNNL
jgi:hypothetical protein